MYKFHPELLLSTFSSILQPAPSVPNVVHLTLELWNRPIASVTQKISQTPDNPVPEWPQRLQPKSKLLSQIIEEQANSVCLPGVVLASVISHESRGVFELTDADVEKANTPKWFLTGASNGGSCLDNPNDPECKKFYAKDSNAGSINVSGMGQLEWNTFQGYVNKYLPARKDGEVRHPFVLEDAALVGAGKIGRNTKTSESKGVYQTCDLNSPKVADMTVEQVCKAVEQYCGSCGLGMRAGNLCSPYYRYDPSGKCGKGDYCSEVAQDYLDWLQKIDPQKQSRVVPDSPKTTFPVQTYYHPKLSQRQRSHHIRV